MIDRPHLVLVGGFLGAGKTTLILAAARQLARRGLRSAAILNDQGDDLVDTQQARAQGIDAIDVTGGCFCCRYPDLVDRVEQLRAHSPDVIFAEPAGSCTDLSATTIEPLRCADYRVAPLTVLVDPERARQLLAMDADEDLAFLFRKQLEEADLICLTKSDVVRPGIELPYPNVRQLSAKSGEGVEAWIDEVLDGRLTAGAKRLEIDYERYARAEAALAWLNLYAVFEPDVPLTAAATIGPFLDAIDSKLTGAGISIVHLKMTSDSGAGFLKAAICGNREEPAIDGALDASPSARHEIRLNLRATGRPEEVREIVESEIGRLRGVVSDMRIACFRPAAPKPWHRVQHAGKNLQPRMNADEHG
jgi:hypothetical protein